MSDDPRVEQLLEELLDSGGTPEEVCRACPELLPEVRAGWQRLRALQAEVGTWFPKPPASDGPPLPALPTADLPRIRGYEVQGVLGRGGMGVVYKAWHPRLNRAVALKMLLAGPYARLDELERFLREAEAVAGLCHANIVQVHDLGDLDGRPYFTMEYVEGGSLAQKLSGTPQPAAQAAALLAALAEAIHVAHQSGIIHRDLTPTNILLAADGTPKITDFGLVRHLDSGRGLTITGVPVGTPSYMAPEQGQGQWDSVGPATDVYALGAIFYELLTGRPPFRAESAAETLRQVVSQDPVPPSRLNPAVPRDAETICLKCLEKDPQKRYPSAAGLAEDLHRFQRREPIMARPVGQWERGLRWMRRNPTGAALVATALALVALAIGGGFWLERQRAEHREQAARQEERERQAAQAAFDKAAILQQEDRWPEALAVLEGAQRLLADSAAIDLIEHVNRARADAEMVAKLEEIRMRLSEGGRSPPALFSAEKMYADAFRNYGIPLLTQQPEEAAGRIRASSIREKLLVFLHDWLHRVPDESRARLREVLDRADDDAWRHAFRKALLQKDTKKLSELAHASEASAQPPGVVTWLAAAMLLNTYKYEAQEFMREAQQRHPNDFWINYQLGCFWWEEFPQEAVGYFRAAAALRPTSDGAYMMLGRASRRAGDTEGALAAFRRSVTLDSSYVVAKELAWLLAPKGGLEEARAAWEKSLERDPPEHEAWYGYAELCLFLGNEEAYRRARKTMLKHFGNTSNSWIIAERTSLACLLLNDSGEDLRDAIRLADLAVALGERSTEPGNPYLRFVKGLALYRDGRPKEAIPLLQEAADKLHDRAGPHLTLAMAQFQSGLTTEAHKTLAAAVQAYNWHQPRAASQDDQSTIWVSYILRREAEATIVPNLRRFLPGNYQPRMTAALDHKRTESKGPSPSILMRLGRLNEAREAWKSTLEGDSVQHDTWYGYAELCLFLGQEDEYQRARRALLERFGATTDPYIAERTARACLLMPATGDELQRILGVAERAVARNSGEQGARAYFEFVRGLAEYRKGQPDRAISAMRGEAAPVLSPGPALVIAMALHQKGQAEEARKTLASAVLSYDWSAGQVRDIHGCILHSLRRQAENMILPNLPAFLDGKYQPQDNDERLGLLGVCQFMNRTRAMARLYADAFAASPSLANDLVAGHRYHAARAAAQVGCGYGIDATTLSEEERARWRKHALQWLRADLDSRARALDTVSTVSRQTNRLALTRCQNDSDLACVRDPGELDKLAPEERKEYLALWADVAAVLAQTQK